MGGQDVKWREYKRKKMVFRERKKRIKNRKGTKRILREESE